jgi:hypothetical protein
MSITLELPRVTTAETLDEFAVDERFAFAAFLVFDDASQLRDDESSLGY